MPPAGLKGELRMRKRALSALAAAVLALVLCQGVMAASPGEVSVSSAQARPGESVTLTVSIRDNPGIAAGIWYIYYDTAVFSADPSKDVAAAGAFARAGSVVGNTIARVRANGRYDGEAGKDGLLVLWDSNTAENVDSSGDMLTVTLRVRPGAAAGSYTIGVGQSPGNVANEKLEDVSLTFRSGTVTVTAGGSQTGGEEPGGQTFASGKECLKNTLLLQLDNYAAVAWGSLKAIDSENHAVTPVLRNDRTLVPVRFVAEALGAQVEWDGEAEQVTITLGGRTVVMTIGKTAYTINGAAHEMDVAPAVEPGWDRTLVPIRFVAEALGMEVEWDGRYDFVLITPAGISWDLNGTVENEAIGEAMGLLALRAFL